MNVETFENFVVAFFQITFSARMVAVNVRAFWINFVGRKKKLIKTSYGNGISFN